MLTQIRTALTLLLLLALLTGLAYPLLVTGIAQTVFPRQAAGSILAQGGKPIASALIGQSFSDPRCFWGRPSATASFPYNAAASSGSNLGPLHPALQQALAERLHALRAADPDNSAAAPVDLVTASASGLDPDISPAAAVYQAPRVARLRGLPLDRVQELIAKHTQSRQWGLLGEPRVNVVQLNLALDALAP